MQNYRLLEGKQTFDKCWTSLPTSVMLQTFTHQTWKVCCSATRWMPSTAPKPKRAVLLQLRQVEQRQLFPRELSLHHLTQTKVVLSCLCSGALPSFSSHTEILQQGADLGARLQSWKGSSFQESLQDDPGLPHSCCLHMAGSLQTSPLQPSQPTGRGGNLQH